MTEKRFTEILSVGVVIDNFTDKKYNCEYRIDDEFLELVNELHEENKQLKQFIQKLGEQGCGKIVLANGNIYKVSAILTDWEDDVND